MRIEQTLDVAVLGLEGSAEELGFRQGEQMNSGPAFEQLKMLQQVVDPQEASRLLEEIHPAFLQELLGLARGLGIDKNTSIQLFSGYNVVMPPMGCSTFANEAYYIRNYDFSDKLYDARFVFQKPASGYASVGFSQQVLGRLDGMNEKGLVIGLHFVNENYTGDGFLATTICRIILDQCATTEEAITFLEKIPHRYCYNYSILDSNGNTAIVEASPDEQVVHRLTPITCTNHFENQEDKNRNSIMVGASKNRKYSMQSLNKAENPLHYYRAFNNKHSPLFTHNYEEFFGTLHTVVYCPKELRIIVGIGGNCEPYTFSLEKWMSGKEVLPANINGKIYVKEHI